MNGTWVSGCVSIVDTDTSRPIENEFNVSSAKYRYIFRSDNNKGGHASYAATYYHDSACSKTALTILLADGGYVLGDIQPDGSAVCNFTNSQQQLACHSEAALARINLHSPLGTTKFTLDRFIPINSLKNDNTFSTVREFHMTKLKISGESLVIGLLPILDSEKTKCTDVTVRFTVEDR